ncbi:MotA/TolQ/ExbB proton channel family protein [Asticcacaulis sp. SL142]|uniref:MotA/TolQ/ExbB proton channel family protein n=1 Tax=Asticcacaulis sp. SL142 TaxID=2995155 RepID=UPI00226D179A|nr:MotA/TolQ/ExbB proton channel family protein [Asticcacaulis sp. SL142]WAC48471.1 MotA/TolQ/ExbB proton channel family protein [Asticcacaulis sp. SL142]
MLEHKKHNPLIALLGAAALFMSVPSLVAAAPATPAAEAAPAPESAPAAAPADDAAAPAEAGHGDLTVAGMFMMAVPVVKVVMIGLVLMSVLSWIILVVKMIEFSSLNKASNNYLEAFRGARSIADINRVSVSDEFAGNPMADMAAVATEEVQISKSAGLSISGEHRDSTLHRAESSINAVQAGLSKRLSGGLTFLASTGSLGPFIGLFGTVYGIMNSFIGIANTNTTNLAVVAPGIAEALLATGIGLAAAIPAVAMYNIFNTMIAAYGTRSEQFVSELMNTLSRQLDKGA